VLTLQFDLSLNIDIAEQEVQAASMRRQPAAEHTARAADICQGESRRCAILTLAVTSTSMPITQVEDLSDTRIAQKISQLAAWPCQHQWRPASGGAHPGESSDAGRLWLERR